MASVTRNACREGATGEYRPPQLIRACASAVLITFAGMMVTAIIDFLKLDMTPAALVIGENVGHTIKTILTDFLTVYRPVSKLLVTGVTRCALG